MSRGEGRGGRGELRAQRWQVTPRGSRDVPLTKLSAVSLHEISANELPDKVSKLSMIVNSWCAREEEGSGGEGGCRALGVCVSVSESMGGSGRAEAERKGEISR